MVRISLIHCATGLLPSSHPNLALLAANTEQGCILSDERLFFTDASGASDKSLQKCCLFFRGKMKLCNSGEEEWKLWLSDDGSYSLCWWRAGIYTAHKPWLSASLCFGLCFGLKLRLRAECGEFKRPWIVGCTGAKRTVRRT